MKKVISYISIFIVIILILPIFTVSLAEDDSLAVPDDNPFLGVWYSKDIVFNNSEFNLTYGETTELDNILDSILVEFYQDGTAELQIIDLYYVCSWIVGEDPAKCYISVENLMDFDLQILDDTIVFEFENDPYIKSVSFVYSSNGDNPSLVSESILEGISFAGDWAMTTQGFPSIEDLMPFFDGLEAETVGDIVLPVISIYPDGTFEVYFFGDIYFGTWDTGGACLVLELDLDESGTQYLLESSLDGSGLTLEIPGSDLMFHFEESLLNAEETMEYVYGYNEIQPEILEPFVGALVNMDDYYITEEMYNRLVDMGLV